MNILALSNKIFQLAKMGKLPSFILGFICWVFLLLPTTVSDLLGITSIINSNRTYFGFGALIFSVYFLAFLAYEFSENLFSKWKIIRRVRKYLRDLTEDEKVALRPFIYENVRTQQFSMSEGTAGSLEGKKIIYRSSNIGSFDGAFPYSIQDIAFKYLKANTQLLSNNIQY
jgi:hypothetical protein